MAVSFCRLRYICKVVKHLRNQLHTNQLFRVQAVSNFSTCSNIRLHETGTRLLKEGEDKFTQAENESLESELQHLQDAIAEVEADALRANRRVVKRRPHTYDSSQPHIPVMADEVLHYLGGSENQTILDMTFGAGGHSRALLESIPGCHILALDRDPTAHAMACELAKERSGKVTPLLGRFSELPTLFAEHGILDNSLDGVLMDLGSSSMQFDQSERGFSISADGPLDMRMDGNRYQDQPTAADVVNSLDEVDLTRIIKKYGEDGQARKIAHGIVEARSRFGRIRSTQQLAEVILEICEGGFGTDKLGRYTHPATKTFQALRIFVNNEMNELNFGLEMAHTYLRVGGTCVAICFHSLEDRIVKRHFKEINLDLDKGMTLSQQRRMKGSQRGYTEEQIQDMTAKRWKLLHKKVIEPQEGEVEVNPRSRSAKLRAAVKVF